MKIVQLLFILSLTFSFILTEKTPLHTILDTFASGPKKELFKVYHYLFEKTYNLNSEEGLKRYRIFKDNLKYIEESNSKNLGYTLGITQFTDLTNEEYKDLVLVKNFQTENKRFLESFDDLVEEDEKLIKNNFDPNQSNWDYSSVYPGVKNQQTCGSCWSFTAVAAIEGAYAKKYGKYVALSEQQVLDCATQNYGCRGGFVPWALQYAIQSSGIGTAASYPYYNMQYQCRAVQGVARVTSYQYCSNDGMGVNIKPCTINQYLGLAQQGPVGVQIDASSQKLQNYRTGVIVFSPGECGQNANHAVTLVGWNGSNQAFKIRNSWGANWGDQGYFQVRYDAYDGKNSCFIAAAAFLPIVA